MSADAGKAFANTVNMLPAGLQDVAKDIMVTGTATTEESQKFMAMMPKSAELMQKYAAITESGGTITAEMQNELNNMLSAEGKAAKQQYAVLGKFNKDMAGVYMNTVQASNIQVDSLKNATKEQKEAAEKQATLAAAMEKNKQALSELSNTFQIALANSGILDLMMGAFKFLADLTQTYLIPAFNIMAAVVTSVGGFLLENLKPVFESLTGFIRENMYPTFLKLAGIVVVDVVPVLETLGSIMRTVGSIIIEYVWPAFKAIGGFIFDNIMPIFAGLGVALGVYAFTQIPALIAGMAAQIAATWALVAPVLAAAAPFIAIAAIVAGLVFIFKKLYDNGWSFGTAIDAVKDNLNRFWLTLVDAVNGLLSIIPNALGGISKEEAERRKATNDALRKELDERESARDAERDKTAEGRDKQKKRDEASSKIDQKIIGLKKGSAEGLADANRKEKEALEERTNLNTADSIALLGQELKSQKSAILPPAEAAKKEIEQKGMAKQADEATTKEEAKKKAQADQEAKSDASPVKTQESAESLLASLNTKIDQLIAVGKFQIAINERQLSASQAMSGDLHKMA
jgi:hypothetical protein